VDDLDGIRDSLRDIGADPSLLDEALADRGTWNAVVQEHEALVSSAGAFGVPTIVLDDGEGPAIFGPVIYDFPDDDKTVELWRHTVWLVRYGNFAELKRGRGGCLRSRRWSTASVSTQRGRSTSITVSTPST
jgi:hypothetical protein